ncbi:GMC family oxidoreductase [Novosphingobium sp. 9]|uniref:GMC family oxidoreductase n=1 Tax=Novosphingobium sp. 9 TaxID=2025349 RepID=UPI0021B5CB7D|nr:GMC family oxidoreductase [Novosphingobium sp. 9]
MTRKFACDDIVDAVIVGSGAGGAPLAARLAAAGLSVVVLEAGRRFSPADHTPDERAADIYWMDERLSGGSDPTAFGANNSGMGVGGSTLHWGAFTPRPDARDLKLRSLCGVGEDWPIAHAELMTYIEEVETVLAISGPSSYPWDPNRRYPQAPVARNAPAEAMAKGCAATDLMATDAPAALVTRDTMVPHWGQRRACVNCGSCHQGCRNAAKASMDVTYLPLAQAHGAEIRPGAMVHDLDRDSEGRITAVVYRQGGINHRQRCRAAFLCAGGIETPRLLLNLDLANSSGQVGQNFMAHVATQVWGRFTAEMRMNRGYPSSLISEDMVRPADVTFAGGYLIQSLGVQPVTLANTFARGGLWGEKLVHHLTGYNRLAGIGINGECLPSEDNRLTLSDEVDALGMRKARIDFSYGENEKAIDQHARHVMTAIWEAAGAQEVVAMPRSAHTIGTCRMGSDGDLAVVDRDGRSFDVPNLYICDNSIFPSALCANPALTIMALSLRCADRFLASRQGR